MQSPYSPVFYIHTYVGRLLKNLLGQNWRNYENRDGEECKKEIIDEPTTYKADVSKEYRKF